MIQNKTDHSSLDRAYWVSILEKSKPSDFDGHTDFKTMTPSQRLDALASIVCFVSEFKGRARKNKVDAN